MLASLDITHKQDGGKWAFIITLPEANYPHDDSILGTGKGRSYETYGEFDQPHVKGTPETVLRKVAEHYGYKGPAEITNEAGSVIWRGEI